MLKRLLCHEKGGFLSHKCLDAPKILPQQTNTYVDDTVLAIATAIFLLDRTVMPARHWKTKKGLFKDKRQPVPSKDNLSNKSQSL